MNKPKVNIRIEPLESTWTNIEKVLDSKRRVRWMLFSLVGLIFVSGGIFFVKYSSTVLDPNQLTENELADSSNTSFGIENPIIEKDTTPENHKYFILETDQILLSNNTSLAIIDEPKQDTVISEEQELKSILSWQINPKRLTEMYQYQWPSKFSAVKFASEIDSTNSAVTFIENDFYRSCVSLSTGPSNYYSIYKYFDGEQYLSGDGLGLSLDFLLAFKLSNKWNIKSGLGYTHYAWTNFVGEDITDFFNDKSFDVTHTDNENNNVSIESTSTYKLEESQKIYFYGNTNQVKTSLNYLNLPVIMQYQFGKKKFRLNIDAGLNTQILLPSYAVEYNQTDIAPFVRYSRKSEVQTTTVSSNRITNSAESSTQNEYYLNRLGFSFQTSLSLQYNLSSKAAIGLGPSYNQQIRDFSKQYQSLKKAYFYGLSISYFHSL